MRKIPFTFRCIDQPDSGGSVDFSFPDSLLEKTGDNQPDKGKTDETDKKDDKPADDGKGQADADKGDEGISFFEQPEQSAGDSQSPEVLLGQLATQLKIELTEEEKKGINLELFAGKVNNLVEASKQTIDFSKYDPEVKILYDYIQEHEGSLIGIAMDKQIAEVNRLISEPADDFFYYHNARVLQGQGITDMKRVQAIIDEMVESIEEDKREDYFKKFKGEIVKTIYQPQINERIKAINDEKVLQKRKMDDLRKGEVEVQRARRVEVAKSITDVSGIPISEKDKALLVSIVSSPEFEKEISKNLHELTVLGYLYKTTGSKAKVIYSDIIKNTSNSQYYNGVRNALASLGVTDKGAKSKDDKTGTPGNGTTQINDWSKF